MGCRRGHSLERSQGELHDGASGEQSGGQARESHQGDDERKLFDRAVNVSERHSDDEPVTAARRVIRNAVFAHLPREIDGVRETISGHCQEELPGGCIEGNALERSIEDSALDSATADDGAHRARR